MKTTTILIISYLLLTFSVQAQNYQVQRGNRAFIRESDSLCVDIDSTLTKVSSSSTIKINGHGKTILVGKVEEGKNPTATGNNSHCEGDNSFASGNASHAEGLETIASGDYGSHAEGYQTTSNGWCAHAEGDGCTASYWAHAQNYRTVATGNSAHAEGHYTSSLSEGTHAGGWGVSAYKRVLASGPASFNHSTVNSLYTGQGAEAQYSAILGGINNSTLSSAHNSIVLGGRGQTASDSNTVYVPRITLTEMVANANVPGTIHWDGTKFLGGTGTQWLSLGVPNGTATGNFLVWNNSFSQWEVPTGIVYDGTLKKLTLTSTASNGSSSPFAIKNSNGTTVFAINDLGVITTGSISGGGSGFPTGDINVNGNLSANGSITAQNGMTCNNSQLVANSGMMVNGSFTANNGININNGITVNGNSTMSGNLTMTGLLTASGNIVAGGTLNTGADITEKNVAVARWRGNFASDPTSDVQEGDMYYNTANLHTYVRSNWAWRQIN